MTERQVHLLNLFLERDEVLLSELHRLSEPFYRMAHPRKALISDLNYLLTLGCITAHQLPDGAGTRLDINLDWPTQITESEFFKKAKELPKSKGYPFLSH